MRRALVCLLMVAVPVGAAVLPAGTAGAATGYSGPCHAAVDRYFPANLRGTFHRYVARESRGVPTAVNRSPLHASGCLQLLPRYAGPFLRSAGCSNLLNADCNVRAAYAMYRKAGLRPWRL